MMIHSAMHWPEETNVPFAVDYAAYIFNRLPKESEGSSPLERFSGSKVEKTWAKRCQVFGCPAIILEPKIQDGNKLP